MPSTSTKRTIVTMAYEESSLAGYEFDVTPEELVTALRRLDALMAEWEPTIALGYNFPAVFGNGDLDDLSGIPDFAIDVAAKYLALRISPMMGKTYSAESRYALAAGMRDLRAKTAVVPVSTLPITTPRGMGNRYLSRWQPFIGNDGLNALPTLQSLTLSASTTPAGLPFTAVISITTNGSNLSLLVNPGNLYSLTSAPGQTLANGQATTVWTLVRAASGLFATIDAIVVQETLAGANDSPKSTPFVIYVTAALFPPSSRAAYVPVLAL